MTRYGQSVSPPEEGQRRTPADRSAATDVPAGTITRRGCHVRARCDVTTLVDVRAVSVHAGGARLLDEVSLTIRGDEFVGLVGPAGAGKTLLADLISGTRHPTSGRIVVAGADLTDRDASVRASLGVVRTWQNPREVAGISILDHVRMATRFAAGLDRQRAEERARDLLVWAGLENVAHHATQSLDLAGARRLDLAAALACNPEVLIADSLTAGLPQADAEPLAAHLAGLYASGVVVIWIERAVEDVVDYVDRIVALDHGHVVADGPATEVSHSSEVRRRGVPIGGGPTDRIERGMVGRGD